MLKFKFKFGVKIFCFLAIALFILSSSNFVQAKDATEFSIVLQTPFVRPPTNEEKRCDKDDKIYHRDEDNTDWVCRKPPKEELGKWQQAIVGKDGNDILTKYAGMLYVWIAGFLGLIAVLMGVAGGIQVATAGADQEGLQNGKNRIINALIGLGILFLSSLILYTINPNFFIF